MQGQGRVACYFTKKCFFFYANGWIMTKLTHDGPQTGLHQGVLKPHSQGQGVGHLRDITKVPVSQDL